MPGSLARPPRHECIDRGSRRRTHRWARRGARDDHGGHTIGAAMVVAAMPPSSGLWRQRSSTVLTAKRPSTTPHLEKTPGLQAPSNRWGGRDTTAGAEKGGKSPSKIEPKQIEPQRARSTGRRSVAMAMNGGKTDESPRSNGRAWWSGANAPHGDGGARRSSPESSDEVAGDSQSPERRGLGLGRASEREWGGRSTGPGWSGLVR
jgi:hypothetical protein